MSFIWWSFALLLILLQHLQRPDIVNGVVKVDGVTNKVTIDQEDKIEGNNFYHPILFLLRMEALHALTFCCIFLQRKEFLTSGLLQ